METFKSRKLNETEHKRVRLIGLDDTLEMKMR